MYIVHDSQLSVVSENRLINPNIYHVSKGKSGFSEIATSILPNKSFKINVNSDTEYKFDIDKLHSNKKIICCQYREINQSDSGLFFHFDMNNIIVNHPYIDDKYLNELTVIGLIKKDGITDNKPNIFYYLECLTGYELSMIPVEKEYYKSLKTLTLNVIGHFLIVDYQGIFEYNDNVINESINYYLSTGLCEYRKNLKSLHKVKGEKGDFFNNSIPVHDHAIQFKIGQEIHHFKLNIQFTDTIAKIGNSSYQNFADTVNHQLPFKNELTKDDKKDMLQTYLNNPVNFIKYSLGDCESDKLIDKLNDLIKDVYASHKLEKYYQDSRDTIGSTVASSYTAYIQEKTGIDNQDDLEKYFPFNTSELKKFKGDTVVGLSSIFGGRCHSNDKSSRVLGPIVDIDLAGAYNSKLNQVSMVLPLSLKGPKIISYPIKNLDILRDRKNIDSLSKKCMTLRECLAKYQDYFLDNLFMINFSTIGQLPFNQDLFPSRLKFQIATENNQKYLKEKTGTVKIFHNEITNGVLCSESLSLLLNDCNAKNLSYFLDNTFVTCLAYYDKRDQVNFLDDLSENDFSWFSVSISDFTSRIQGLRSIFKDGQPLNIIHKLFANTIYGNFCSPWFIFSNPIIANSITDSIRVLCYLLEKKCNGKKSITDGVQMDFHNVFINRTNQNSFSIFNQVGLNNLSDRELHDNKLKRTSFNNLTYDLIYEKTDDNLYILIDNTGKKYTENDLNDLICDYTYQDYQHLPSINNKCISGQFTTDKNDDFLTSDKGINYYFKPVEKKGSVKIKIKGVYKNIALHGSANYLLTEYNDNQIVKFRSYRTDGYSGITDDLKLYDIDCPSKVFMNELLHNPNNVNRGQIFYKSVILKPNMYKVNKDKYDYLGYKIGDNFPQVGYLCEFSLSNFNYKNYQQYHDISNDVNNLKNKYGQCYEMFFIINGKLNYDLMNTVISDLIDLGISNISTILKRKYKISESEKYHPCFNRLVELKKHLNKDWQKMKVNNSKNKILFGLDVSEYNLDDSIVKEYQGIPLDSIQIEYDD